VSADAVFCTHTTIALPELSMAMLGLATALVLAVPISSTAPTTDQLLPLCMSDMRLPSCTNATATLPLLLMAPTGLVTAPAALSSDTGLASAQAPLM
jgi:hypothetical protein